MYVIYTYYLFFTRKTDTLVPLAERAGLANSQNIDLFLSLHVNASPKTHIQGIETYIVSTEKINTTIDIATRENSSIYLEENPEEQYKAFLQKNPEFYIQQNILQRDLAKKSLELADKIQDHLTGITKSPDRSVKQAGFVVLFLTKMPSVLIEIGFLSNKEEEEKMRQDGYIEKIAQGIVNGLLTYVQEKNKLFEALDRKKNKETGFYTIQIGRSKNNLVLIPQNFKGLNEVFKIEKNGVFMYFYAKFKLKEDAKEQLKIVKKKYTDSFVLQWNE
jgi:N-acetylmuramoyl-L-alanine amidase